MAMFVIQSALLILISFIIGCLMGAWLHRILGVNSELQATTPEPTVATAATAFVKKAPAKKPAPKKPVQKAASSKDNLKQVKGIGPAIEKKLNASGIHTFAQIAGWSAAQQSALAEKLAFSGRVEREEWVKQAKVLAKGSATQLSKRVTSDAAASPKVRK